MALAIPTPCSRKRSASRLIKRAGIGQRSAESVRRSSERGWRCCFDLDPPGSAPARLSAPLGAHRRFEHGDRHPRAARPRQTCWISKRPAYRSKGPARKRTSPRSRWISSSCMMPIRSTPPFHWKRPALPSAGRVGSWRKTATSPAEISLQGSMPISTMGGLKARGNPGGAAGVYQAVEAAHAAARTSRGQPARLTPPGSDPMPGRTGFSSRHPRAGSVGLIDKRSRSIDSS